MKFLLMLPVVVEKVHSETIDYQALIELCLQKQISEVESVKMRRRGKGE